MNWKTLLQNLVFVCKKVGQLHFIDKKAYFCYHKLMRIREINSTDKENIKNLLVELQQYIIEIDKYNLNIISKEYRNNYFDFMIEDCKTQQGKIFVAIDNETITGFIAGYVQTYDEREKLNYSCPKKGIIAELIVNKNSRSKGAGNELLLKMEDYFKSIDCKYIQIDVFAYNEPPKSFTIKISMKKEC